MLTEATLFAVLEAAIAANLDRSTLIGGIDRRLTSNLPGAPTLKEQLLADLQELCRTRPTRGAPPLRTWLTTAAKLAEPRPQAAVFKRALEELDAAARKPARKTPAPASRQAASSEPTHASIVLDRILQWSRLVDRCKRRDREHVVFLVHGSMEQDLRLFLRRIRSYLSDQCQWSHSLVKVERTRDGTSAQSPDEWKRSLVQGSRARKGELDFVLSHEATSEPVLLLFCDSDGPLRGLDKKATLGLIQFLRSQLDLALTSLESRGKIRHPVRVVLPIEHPLPPAGKADPAVEQIEAALQKATSLRLEHLPALELPSWPDVEHHILTHYPDADAEIIGHCQSLHRDLLTSADCTLQLLGDTIDEALVDWSMNKHY